LARNRHKREYELAIDALSHEGRGVGRVEGKTVFVDLALPGERVMAQRFRKRAKFDEAIATELLAASPARVPPPCAFYERCGGCSLQHLAPEDQIAHKASVLVELIERAAGVAPETMLPPLTGPTLGYRRKARLGVKHVPKKGGVLVGFRERRNPFIADIERCVVLHPIVGERLEALAALVGALSVPDRIPQFEVAIGDDTAALVVRHLAPLTAADLATLADFGREHDIMMFVQPGGDETVAPVGGERSDAALDVLTYRVDNDLVFRFRPTDFTQVNTDINRAMVARVIELLDPGPEDRVLDLFSGLGNFSLPIARRAAHVTGIEGEAGLVARAKANARANGIDNVWFDARDLADPEHYTRRFAQAIDKLVVDPPRSGAAALFETADLGSVRRIVYVSCNPATLARDIDLAVSRHGFTLSAAGVMDMFPHTAHVESIAVLDRR